MAATESLAVGRLAAALRDVRRIESPPGSERIEEPEPAFRVCDEAYLALRRILHQESEIQYTVEVRHFLQLSDERKNREIANHLETGAFTQFLDPVDEEQ
jgi:hypothetical protein